MPNWVFGAAALALLALATVIIEAIQNHREQKLLHAIFDGDRMQSQRAYYAHKYDRIGGYDFVKSMNIERRYF